MSCRYYLSFNHVICCLENYVHLLEAALNDTDAEYTKTIVKLLVETKIHQKNFSVRFLPTANSKNYFR